MADNVSKEEINEGREFKKYFMRRMKYKLVLVGRVRSKTNY